VARVTLAIVEGTDVGREIAVTARALIGRDPGADVVITDSEVSSRHASVALADGGLVLEDLGSTNGTFVNGQSVSGPQQLKSGDRIRLGATVLEVRVAVPTASPERIGPPAMALTRVRQIPTLPVLVFVEGERAGIEIPVGTQIVVGRDPGAADVVLSKDTDVSRRHATFSPAGAGLTVEDLGSTNGTFVNGHRLTGTAALSNGDRVQLGGTAIAVRLPGELVVEPAAVAPIAEPEPAPAPGLPPNGIVVEDLVKEFGSHRAVDGINLHVEPSEIYGFLGPNGAGKSTTVHMLTTLLPPSSGVARIAGFDVTADGPRVRATIGVALQAAALDPSLNSWEHMALQTALQGIPKAERKKRAEELIERVGLMYAADRRVGGYSGGMKRRLDLALALVHRPRVLFLDEPTTGLDPQSRSALWEEVARLVNEDGMTVFLTTQYLEEADIMADRIGIIDHGEIVAEGTPAGLKAEIGRPTAEVVPRDASDWAAVSEVLSRFGELVSAAHKGVAVRLRPGVDDIADVVRALDAANLHLANVQLHAPTLDDVFLAKTGHSLEGGAGEDGDSEEPGLAAVGEPASA
jgi:ABC-2 type transport system ATP-binding protein